MFQTNSIDDVGASFAGEGLQTGARKPSKKKRSPSISKRLSLAAKRGFDIVAASLGLIVFALPLLFLIWRVRQKLGKPALFRQTRPGMNGKPFAIIKLRTMTDERDAKGNLLPDADRLTPFGSFLRSSSLDELPELWNVVKGEMSLVGPRPLLQEYMALYTPAQMRRHKLRPGITGWAQVNGRNALKWDSRLKLDTWYVDNRSMMMDIKILWMTVSKVLNRADISEPGEATASKFTGSEF